MASNISPFGGSLVNSATAPQQQSGADRYHPAMGIRQSHVMAHSLQGLQLSGADLSALEGISTEQLATIARLFQSGILPFPSQTSQPSPREPNGIPEYISQSRQGDVDMISEKEDGEVDDGEIEQPSQPEGFLRPPPTGPRNLSRHSYSPASYPNPQPDLRLSAGPSTYPSRTSVSTTSFDASTSHASSSVTAGASGLGKGAPNIDGHVDRHNDSRLFVTELHKAGYTFDQVAKELKNPKPLRRLFEELGLSVSSGSPLKDEPVTANPASDRKTSSTKKTAQKQAAPKDRSEYLAKLKAAKNKKPESSPSITASVTVIDRVASLPPTASSIATMKESQLSGKQPPVGKANNELIRQRLEALKAEQAAKKNALEASRSRAVLTISTHDQDSTTRVDQTMNKDTREYRRHKSPENAHPGHTQNVNVLPGLYMPASDLSADPSRASFPEQLVKPIPTSTQDEHPSSTRPIDAFTIPASPLANPNQQSTTNKVGSRKRGVASDFYDNTSYSPGSNTPKRPFGQNRNHSASESLIITVSDDEDGDDDDDMNDADADDDEEGDEMDLDESSDEEPPLKLHPVNTHGHVQGNIRSQQTLPQSAVSSTPGTPSALERTEQGLFVLRQMLAEAERRKAAGKKDMGSVSENSHIRSATILALSGNTVDQTKQSVLTLDTDEAESDKRLFVKTFTSDEIVDPVIRTPTKPVLGTTIEREAEKERLRRRLQELNHARLRNVSTTAKALETNVDVGSISKTSVPALSGTVINEDAPHDVLPDIIPSDGSPILEKPAGNVPLHDQQRNVSNGTRRPDADLTCDSGTNSESDDLDDVYEQASVTTPATRSLTSAKVDVDEVMKENDENMESTENSSVEDNDDDDDLYEPMTLPSHGRPEMATEEDSKARSIDNSSDTDEDDIIPELQSSSQNTKPLTGGPGTPTEESVKQKAYFTPYESPLLKFKDYRYHPEFLSTVSGGFKSLTFSNKINSEKSLCPYDAAGGKCNDKDCQFQHFDDMGLSDNDLLRVMGTEHVPAKTPEEDRKWKEGLTAVIKQLRSTKHGKDVEAIAHRIAVFRREFIQDPTRTLCLD